MSGLNPPNRKLRAHLALCQSKKIHVYDEHRAAYYCSRQRSAVLAIVPLREASQILRDEMSEDEKKPRRKEARKKEIILLSIQTTDNEVLVNLLRRRREGE